MKNRLLAALILLAAALPIHTRELYPSGLRTVRVRIAVDEEFRRRTFQFLETRKWVAAASYFFEKNFGLALQIEDLKYWSSDNSQRTLSGLFQDLYEDIERGESDIVLGFTGQIRSESEVSGVASYRHGYALAKRMKYEYLTRVTVIHELCHLFGAVDLEKERSIMNKDEPRIECDEFTRQIIRLNRNRRFDPANFPLSPEDMNSALAFYLERKRLNRGEPGVPLMLAIFYLEMEDYEKAILECLEAEKIAPQDPAVQRLLRLAQQRK
jgi:tetratricopeptide (TPR) repeat protein